MQERVTQKRRSLGTASLRIICLGAAPATAAAAATGTGAVGRRVASARTATRALIHAAFVVVAHSPFVVRVQFVVLAVFSAMMTVLLASLLVVMHPLLVVIVFFPIAVAAPPSVMPAPFGTGRVRHIGADVRRPEGHVGPNTRWSPRYVGRWHIRRRHVRRRHVRRRHVRRRHVR